MPKHLKEMRGWGGKKRWRAWKKCCVLHPNNCLESWGPVGSCQHLTGKPRAVSRLTRTDGRMDGWLEEPWPGSILLQASEDMNVSPGGLQMEKPAPLSQCCWVEMEMAALQEWLLL